jgi:hypothetical protein
MTKNLVERNVYTRCQSRPSVGQKPPLLLHATDINLVRLRDICKSEMNVCVARRDLIGIHI